MPRSAVLDDADRARIEPLLPSSQGCPDRPFRNHRQVVAGIVYRYRTGIPWRDLPAEFGPWETVCKRHRRFSLDSTWDRLLTKLLTDADAAGTIDWQVSVDSTGAGASARRHGPGVPPDAHLAHRGSSA
jgi:transposase